MYLPMAGKSSYVITLHLLMVPGREKKKIREREREREGEEEKNYVLICCQDLIDNLQVWGIIIVQWGELLWNNIQTDIESI